MHNTDVIQKQIIYLDIYEFTNVCFFLWNKFYAQLFKKKLTVPVVFFMSTFGTLEEKPSHDFWP